MGKENGRKGFTLIELLAVIIIVVIVLLIAVPAILNIISKFEMSVYENNEEKLESAAKIYLVSNNIEFPATGGIVKITLDELKNSSLIGNIYDAKKRNIECDAYIEARKVLKAYVFEAFLDCGENYKTKGYDGLQSTFVTAVGSGEIDYFKGISKSTNGYVAVGHSDSNSKDLLGLNKGGTDGVIVSYDNNSDIVWKKTYGGKRHDYFYGVASSSDGHVAVGFTDSVDIDLAGLNKGSIDAIIVKYDNDGNLLWNKNFGGTGADYFNSVIAVTDGYIAVGYTASSNGDLTGLSKGGTDAIIVKYDNNGNVVWNKNYGGSSTDRFYGVRLATDGIVAVGTSTSINGDLTGLNKVGYDGIIVKYDNSGNLIWNKNYGGTGIDYLMSVDTAIDGYIAVGYSNSTTDDLLTLNKGDYDGIVVKYDNVGNVVWKKNYGGTLADNFIGVSILADTSFIVVGRAVSSNGDLTGLFKGGTYCDASIVKYDNTGNIVWNKNYGGTSYDYFEGIATSSDTYVAVGYSLSTGGDLAGLNKAEYDGIIVSYDTLGSITNKKNFGGGPGEDYFDAVASVQDGYIAVGNNNTQDGIFEGLNKGGVDSIIFKYDLTGNIVWNKNFGGTSTDSFYAADRDTDGVIVAGTSTSSNGDLLGKYKGTYDATLVKYDNDGNIIWNKNYGGTGADYFYGVKKSQNGYIAVGCSASTTDDLIGLNKGGTDAIIFSFDNDGNIIWKKNFGGTGSDIFKSIYLTASGYITVGYSNSNDGDLQGMNNGLNDAIIVMYDFEGNEVFKKNYGGTLDDYFFSVAKDDSSFYAIGYGSSVDGNLTGLNQGGADAILVKYDSNGEILWNKNYGGTSTDRFYSVEIFNNQIVAVGYCASTNGDLTGLNKGTYDGIFVKYDVDGNIVLKKNYGGTGADSFKGISVLRDGLVMVGYTSSLTNDFLEIGSGYYDAISVIYKDS